MTRLKDFNYYGILTRAYNIASSKGIESGYNEIKAHNIGDKETLILMGALTRMYTGNTSLANKRIEEYTGLSHLDSRYLNAIGNELLEYSGDIFNAILILASNKARTTGLKNTQYFVKLVKLGPVNTLDIEKIQGMDTGIDTLREIYPKGQLKCQLCEAEKPVTDFKLGSSYCKECRELRKSLPVSRDNSIKLNMAKEAATMAKK